MVSGETCPKREWKMCRSDNESCLRNVGMLAGCEFNMDFDVKLETIGSVVSDA